MSVGRILDLNETHMLQVTPSIVRIPSTEVELQFSDKDVLSGFLLNDK